MKTIHTQTHTRTLSARQRHHGFSLIELLVAMAIALVVTLAITSVLMRTEGTKRSTSSVNDLNQNGAYAAFVLDRAVRSAGSGFSQRWREAYGCSLQASNAGTIVLPLPNRFPATSAFENVPQIVRLAPFIIGRGMADKAGSVRGDVLVVMGSTAPFGGSPQLVLPASVSAADLRLPNTLGYRTGDILLLADPVVAGGCMLQQANFTDPNPLDATFPPGSPKPGGSTDTLMPLGGKHYAAAGKNVNLTSFGDSTAVVQMGNATDNPPQLHLYGVGANDTLVSFDLLQKPTADTPLADGVVEMRALYGVDTTVPPDGTLDTWVNPVAGSGYESSVLLNGTATSQTTLRTIVAVRLGFVLRTSLPEKDYVTPAGSVALFGDMGAAFKQTRAVPAADQNFRHRTVEITIPLRNVLTAANK